MKLYLAHPMDLRKEIREIELVLERETGVELFNPFYDNPGREYDLEEIDSGAKDKWDVESPSAIVYGDLSNLLRCYGVLAIIPSETQTIGTICEAWYGMSFGKMVFIITDMPQHPWIRFIAITSKGLIFSGWEEFKKYLLYRRDVNAA